MAKSATARGVAAVKNTGTTLALSVTARAGSSILLFVQSDGGAPSSVAWGVQSNAHGAVQLGSVTNATSGHTATAWLVKYVRADLTQNVVATWGATNQDRLIAAVELTEATIQDIAVITSTQNASTSPNTGAAGTSVTADTIQIAYFGSDGHASDTPGVVGDGHALLQNGGTTPSAVAGFVTTKILTTLGAVRSSATGATINNWCNMVVTLKKRHTFTIKICEQRHRRQNHKPDYVWVTVEDESGNQFEEPLDPNLYDGMTDDEFIAWVRKLCTIWTANILDGEYEAVIDSSRDIRMLTFVNDTITI